MSKEERSPLRGHLDAAIDWICLAHTESGDGGISKGYDYLRRRWFPSYPETTGYTIPTLLNTAAMFDRPELRDLAFSLGDYLLGAATAEGGVSHWASATPKPIVFDTGQVIFGWVAAFKASGDEKYRRAAERAGDWLVSAQHPGGSWRQHQHLGTEKVIDTRVAWSLLELHGISARAPYVTAARKNLDWAVSEQDPDGWFSHCGFSEGEDPYTHTIAYTAEGLFECGRLLEDSRYIKAATLTADALRARQRKNGQLTSTFARGWRESSRSVCLTGNCQMTRLWLRLWETTGVEEYRDAARRSIWFVAGKQRLTHGRPAIRGAIAGSYPIFGRYERFKYPNWAAKFFVDALLTLEQLENPDTVALTYAG